jgi:hypothetical protein
VSEGPCKDGAWFRKWSDYWSVRSFGFRYEDLRTSDNLHQPIFVLQAKNA